MLRLVGVAVGPQATWVAAALLLPLILPPSRIHGAPQWPAERLLQVALVWGLGAVQAFLVALAEWALHGRTEPGDALASVLGFGLCWTPLALTVQRMSGDSPFARWSARVMLWGCVLLGVVAARTLWLRGLDGQLAKALALAAASVVLGTWRIHLSNHQKCA